MQRRGLGSTGFEISTIGLGTWAIGGFQWGGQDDQQSIEALHAAIDHGVNWVDTAPIYGSGQSERPGSRYIRAPSLPGVANAAGETVTLSVSVMRLSFRAVNTT